MFNNTILITILLTSMLLGVQAKGGRFQMHTALGISKEKRDAVQYCGRLAEKAWKPKVDIRVNIFFAKIDDTILAHARPTKFEYVDEFLYPIAIAKQLKGEDMNKHMTGSRFYDIKATFQDEDFWYYGTDRKTPKDKFDFVTVCLHEVFHGVHMIGWGYNFTQVGDHQEAVPKMPQYNERFDRFLTFQTSQKSGFQNCPLDSIKDDPKKLAAALTAGNIWFSSSQRKIARLNAPKNFTGIYHLDSEFSHDVHGLMRPHRAPGQATHAPEPDVLGILHTLLDTSAKPLPMCNSSVEPDVLFRKRMGDLLKWFINNT